MIAPTNCNPDCDCAQRMVRCQRAAPIDEVARESLVRRNVFLDVESPRGGLHFDCTKEPPAITGELHFNSEAVAEAVEEAAAYMAAHPDVFVPFFETGSEFILKNESGEPVDLIPPTEMTIVEPPPYVIPASLADAMENPVLDALEKEFPATTGIAPTDEAPIPLAGTEFLTVTSEYDGAWGPWMMVGYDRTILRQRLIQAFRDCELDCGCWSPSALRQLADIAIATLEAK